MYQDKTRALAVELAAGLHANGLAAKPPELILEPFSEIEEEEVRWLWTNRLALGKIALFVGDPGSGKSFATTAVAAALSRGDALPGDSCPLVVPCDVLIANFEDGAADTIKPRLRQCGADFSRVFNVTGTRCADDSTQPFTCDDVPLLEAQLDARPNVKVVVLDPIAAAMPGVDSHKDAEIRSTLAPLAALAERRDICIVCVMHLNKASALKAAYRIGGSIAFMAVARTVLLFAEDQESSRRVCASMKNSLGPRPESVGFGIDGEGFHWMGIADRTAEQLLAPPAPERRSERQSAAEEFLLEAMADGTRLANDVIAEAEQRGIARMTLNRAKNRLGFRRTGGGKGGPVRWSLAEDTTPPTTKNMVSTVHTNNNVVPIAPGVDTIDTIPTVDTNIPRGSGAVSMLETAAAQAGLELA